MHCVLKEEIDMFRMRKEVCVVHIKLELIGQESNESLIGKSVAI